MKRALRRSSQQEHLVVIDLKSHEFADDVKQTLCGTVVDEIVAADFRVIYEELEVSSGVAGHWVGKVTFRLRRSN